METPSPHPPLTFDARLTQDAMAFVRQQIEAVPELRGMAVIHDFLGPFNRADIPAAVWLSRDSGLLGLQEAPAILGLLSQMQKLVLALNKRLNLRLEETTRLVTEHLQRQAFALEPHDKTSVDGASRPATRPTETDAEDRGHLVDR
jgi:hypothetical protein